MKRIIKFCFCLFLVFILLIYLRNNYINNDKGLLAFIINSNEYSSAKKNNEIIERIFSILVKKDVLDPNNILSSKRDVFYDAINSDDVFSLEIDDDPIIYLYSTHQTEEYKMLSNDLYNFVPTVMTASYILEDLLEEKGFNVIVEQRSVKEGLNANGWDYSYSYRISKQYLLDAKNNYPTLKYFIDIHRDSVYDKSISTVNIDGKSYAKLMFLLGQNRDNYEENYNIVKLLENDLNANYNGIMRNIYFQKDYTYNQEMYINTFLVEVGTYHNTIDEVYNSMVAFADTLERYIMGGL